MAKPSLADRINEAIKKNDTKTGIIPRGKGPDNVPARTYISPTDAYEDELGQDRQTIGFHPGSFRGQWSLGEQQNASIPTTVLTSSGNAGNNALAAIQGGIPQNPKAPPSVWAAVPQMILNVPVKGPVMIHGNVSVRSSTANDTAGFAIYRDGKLIGNHVTHTLPATASATTIVQLSAIDEPPSGTHLYAMYWSPGTGTLIANSNQRNLYVINLTPQ